ncbi:MAG: hypothetical protein EXR59_03455 [Dehalococcoidia bacterium]|nr:hypothetical protein [Dehalococcoidia bacterium]
MFVQIDVKSGRNNKDSLELVFNGLGKPYTITKVMTDDRVGVTRMHKVTGWSTQGPCDAIALIVEDSGAGSALLIQGGDEGLRLMADDINEAWDLDSANQWGEACLLLSEDAETA